MLDRERILAKIDELEGYLHDLRTIAPESFTVYQQIEKKRACERLLQIAAVIALPSQRLGLRGLDSVGACCYQGIPSLGTVSPCMLTD